VLRLYQERYADFNVRHFHEKLGEEHGIRLSHTWVKQALPGAGLVARRRKRGRRGLWKSGNLAESARFPLSHSLDDYDSPSLQIKCQTEGCLVKPDRSRANKTGHLDMLTTVGTSGPVVPVQAAVLDRFGQVLGGVAGPHLLESHRGHFDVADVSGSSQKDGLGRALLRRASQALLNQ
jgi:hypothetical protein